MSCLLNTLVWDQSTCKERIESDQIQNEKYLLTVGLEPTTLRFVAWYSTDWANRVLGKAVLLKCPFIHTCTSNTNVLYWYNFKNDEVQRILSGRCTVLCYIFEYACIYIPNSKKTHKPCVCYQLAKHDQLYSTGLSAVIRQKSHVLESFSISVNNRILT